MTTHEHPTRPVKARDLDDTMTLVGESGGLSSVYESRSSTFGEGLQTVETEHGMLLLDPDHDYDVLVLPHRFNPIDDPTYPQLCTECGQAEHSDDPAALHIFDDVDDFSQLPIGHHRLAAAKAAGLLEDHRLKHTEFPQEDDEQPDREPSAEQERAWDEREDEMRGGLT